MGLEQLISSVDSLPSVSGVAEDIIYRNASNDYTVISFLTDDGREIVAVGCLPDVHKGEPLLLYGDWSYHANYGQQFTIESYQKTLPTETNDILKYLSSGVIKGVGPVTALKIVNRFGTDTFDVIENHPTWLSDIPGITRKKAAEITKIFREQNGLRQLMMCCRDYLGTASISRVYREWGDRSVSIIEENPYRLCDEIYGVGFERADDIAKKLGIVADSEFRITSGLRYVLNEQAASAGHTCLPRDILIRQAAQKLQLPEDKVTQVLDEQIRRKHLICYLPGDKDYIFTAESDRSERYIAKKLMELSVSCEILPEREIDRLIEITETERGISYASLQRKAICEALSSGVMILTGGPGTGKTTVVQALIRMCRQMGLKTALAAPTGRAAKRMSAATGEEARTIHRMLEMDKTDDDNRYHFKRNANNPLDEKVIIIDEASMIDMPLMEGLLRAIIRGTRLILIGDDNQLPPVGCGNVFRDMIASGRFRSVCLTEIFRQSKESMIIVNAHRINHGELPLLHTKNNDSFFMARASDDQIVDTIISLVTTRLPRAYGPEVIDKIQIITPSRKGKAGTENLNKLLKDYLNPKSETKKEIKYRDTVFREGDKVMQIRNNYDIEWKKGEVRGTGAFNGDIGVITRIDPQEETLVITYDGKEYSYEYSMLEEVEHAYAITVHKSQGSEYPLVIIPLYNCAPLLRTRNLFYTALTRAKEMVIMVGSEYVAQNMVENDHHSLRYTALRQRLEAAE